MMLQVYSHLFASALFFIGLLGLIRHRSNLLILMMCLELMLLGVSTNFITFSQFHQDMTGQIVVFFILTVAAAETAIGLALLVLLFRKRDAVSFDVIHDLRG